MAKVLKTPVNSRKAACEVSKEQFEEKAKSLKVTIAGQDMVANKKVFSSGSYGWFASGKMVVEIDGTPVVVQCGVNLTIVGSKPASAE